MPDRPPHVVIVVVNLPAERDRRVIRQCRALEEAGYRVTVICPRGSGDPGVLPGTERTAVRPFRQPFAGSGVLSFAAEFAWALVAVTGRLLALMLRTRVDAVQTCNPPDVFWIVGLLLRAAGRPFVFDHHDLSPELYECKTDRPRRGVLRLLRIFEKLSWRCASAVIATNQSYRDLAISRGGCDPDRVVVVRNGPTLAEVGGPPGTSPPAARQNPAPRQNPAHRPASAWRGSTPPQTIVYLGVINEQDRVDLAVLAAERLVELRGDADWRLVVAGDGECLPPLRRLTEDRGLTDVVRFTGWLEPDQVNSLLHSASIALQPDPPTRMAELSTMAKTVEYLGRGLPVVAVDLLETRRTAGAAASYVPTGSPDELAAELDRLLDDPDRRAGMRDIARRRFADQLAWDHQARSYIDLWNRLIRPDTPGNQPPTPTPIGDTSALTT
ncbi:glycosyltransferase family 4 protein [Solwaraspora sp. WMMD1047]|uniref:glycosyltransferase family 4 protein n=1 Tax=Solwaraspora sp. WMMD1047 TaxID=3016102 RepID=UPI0024162D4D|nr:glycosyltransferase family 4 protein [Solwaraspora sp. WMMD1047]MDG4828831.1 glycosyltransferase family 4 protein [Solwaraspora sp. WMMD1047]